jgi:hypothetical protein
MTPTNKLRFVEREIETEWYGDYVKLIKVRVLQQWWEPECPESAWPDKCPGEWRDVPLEEEE